MLEMREEALPRSGFSNPIPAAINRNKPVAQVRPYPTKASEGNSELREKCCTGAK